MNSNLPTHQEHENRAAIRLAVGHQEQNRQENERREQERVLRWLGSKAPVPAKTALRELRRQQWDRLQILKRERARVLAERRKRDLMPRARRRRSGQKEDRLLAYWRAAKIERENAKRRAPSKGEVRQVKLSTAPWTLAGGAVETNRRKH